MLASREATLGRAVVREPILYLMCGLPFAGKTTVALRLAEAIDAVYISLDEINAERGLYGGEGIALDEWELTHRLALERLERVMRDSASPVVVDDTSNLRWIRDRWRETASRAGYDTRVVHVDPGIDVLRKRMEDTERSASRPTVASSVFKIVADSFEPPGQDENAIRIRSASELARVVSVANRPTTA
jgi:predicted kinase